jgi:hypothetical protein
MNAARSLVLTDFRPGAMDQAPRENAETPVRAHQRGRLALRRITGVSRVDSGSERQAPKRGTSINMARYGIAEPIDGTEVTERTRV